MRHPVSGHPANPGTARGPHCHGVPTNVPVKRIKSNWHQTERNIAREKDFDDRASALAFIIWRIALEGAKDLHRERYNYASDPQRAAVIAEFVAFLLHCSDRLVYDMVDNEEREVFVNLLGRRLADHMQDNLADLFGPGDYRPSFIANLNERLTTYATLTFRAGEPGYDMLRYFGDSVLRILGSDQTNKWVIDQIMEQAGPDAFKHLKKNLPNVMA